MCRMIFQRSESRAVILAISISNDVKVLIYSRFHDIECAAPPKVESSHHYFMKYVRHRVPCYAYRAFALPHYLCRFIVAE